MTQDYIKLTLLNKLQKLHNEIEQKLIILQDLKFVADKIMLDNSVIKKINYYVVQFTDLQKQQLNISQNICQNQNVNAKEVNKLCSAFNSLQNKTDILRNDIVGKLYLARTSNCQPQQSQK